MKPIRTPYTNAVYHLRGGTEENDLPLCQTADEENNHVKCSTWELTDEERKLIAEGRNINLFVWGGMQPPVMITIAEEDEVDAKREKQEKPESEKGTTEVS